MAYTVYKHTSPSGKVYIGVTSLRPEERWGGGAGYVKNNHFNRAIKKYGWENIKHEILFDDLSKEDAFKIEIELIKEYRSSEREFGYNLGTGGEHGSTGSKWSEQSRKNHMAAIWSKPRKHSEERKRNIGKGVKKHLLENPETKTYFQTATKAQRDDWDKKRSKRILCVETGNIFIGAKAAAEWAGLKNRQSIYFCCEGVGYHKTAGGYHWRYQKDV